MIRPLMLMNLEAFKTSSCERPVQYYKIYSIQ
jgi:hypothetical protein